MTKESASAITADILSVDHLFKRERDVYYSRWRTLLLKQKLSSQKEETVDRRDEYCMWRVHLLGINPHAIRREGKRSYFLEQRENRKKQKSFDRFADTPPETPEREDFEDSEEESPRTSLEESNESENTSKKQIVTKNQPVKRVHTPSRKPKEPQSEEEAARIARAKAIAKKKKQQQILKEKRKQRAKDTEQLPGGGTVSDAYAFTGMHHIWDEHAEAVTRILFANYDNTLLAFGSFDGDISICYALPEPKVHVRIQGHTQCVTDLSFSSSNEMLMSSSVDHSIRVWRVSDGECIRKITDTQEFVSCAFHPFNNNLLFTGTINGYLKVYNLSTGQVTQQMDCSGAVNTITWEPKGNLLFVGDSKGFIYVFEFDQTTGRTTKCSKTTAYGRFARSRPIISIQYKAWSNSPQHRPELLVSCQDNTLKLFNVVSKTSITFKKEFKNIPNTSYRIRSCFCPLISLRDGACIVTGGEDMKIRIFDVLRSDKPCVNELMGHCGPVLDVCWNFEETLMGSCDSTGTVILWKRVKITKPEENEEE